MSDSHNTIFEIWKAIPGFPGYDVSNHGRVRSYWSKVNGTRQREISNTPQKLLTLSFHGAGYPFVNLKNKHRMYPYLVHRLVLLAFVGPCPSGMEACHNDGSRTNNHINNLRYGTRKENVDDRAIHNTNLVGEKHPNCKLNAKQVKQIRLLYENGCKYKYLVMLFNISYAQISRIINYKKWKSI
ncbi:MAG: HNH endonuclease [Dehalococcoidia bacterium]